MFLKCLKLSEYHLKKVVHKGYLLIIHTQFFVIYLGLFSHPLVTFCIGISPAQYGSTQFMCFQIQWYVIIPLYKVNYRSIFNPLNFLKTSLIFGSVNCFLFICALSLLKYVRIITSPVFLACIKVGAAYSESELLLKTSIYVSILTSLL
jgi:hypothetical protein